ncbi:MAG: hypothetical protein GKR91_11195 [Pseudomonadales bacterium]|nr:hypothetical protein [Pseudomonadales bacterium]
MSAENNSAKASIRIYAPATDVLSAFTDAEKMSQFWFSRSDKGLKQGESVAFSIGTGEEAFTFDIVVKELDFPNRLVIEWQGLDELYTQVAWNCIEADGCTVLSIEETGFGGNEENIVTRVIDSTGGFNQVIVAAKAFIEHGVAINVVSSHP